MAMCKNKKKFDTKSNAERILHIAWKNAIANGKKGDLPCRTYKCRECNGWHLTSKKLWTKDDWDSLKKEGKPL